MNWCYFLSLKSLAYCEPLSAYTWQELQGKLPGEQPGLLMDTRYYWSEFLLGNLLGKTETAKILSNSRKTWKPKTSFCEGGTRVKSLLQLKLIATIWTTIWSWINKSCTFDILYRCFLCIKGFFIWYQKFQFKSFFSKSLLTNTTKRTWFCTHLYIILKQ